MQSGLPRSRETPLAHGTNVDTSNRSTEYAHTNDEASQWDVFSDKANNRRKRRCHRQQDSVKSQDVAGTKQTPVANHDNWFFQLMHTVPMHRTTAIRISMDHAQRNYVLRTVSPDVTKTETTLTGDRDTQCEWERIIGTQEIRPCIGKPVVQCGQIMTATMHITSIETTTHMANVFLAWRGPEGVQVLPRKRKRCLTQKLGTKLTLKQDISEHTQYILSCVEVALSLTATKSVVSCCESLQVDIFAGTHPCCRVAVPLSTVLLASIYSCLAFVTRNGHVRYDQFNVTCDAAAAIALHGKFGIGDTELTTMLFCHGVTMGMQRYGDATNAKRNSAIISHMKRDVKERILLLRLLSSLSQIPLEDQEGVLPRIALLLVYTSEFEAGELRCEIDAYAARRCKSTQMHNWSGKNMSMQDARRCFCESLSLLYEDWQSTNRELPGIRSYAEVLHIEVTNLPSSSFYPSSELLSCDMQGMSRDWTGSGQTFHKTTPLQTAVQTSWTTADKEVLRQYLCICEFLNLLQNARHNGGCGKDEIVPGNMLAITNHEFNIADRSQ